MFIGKLNPRWKDRKHHSVTLLNQWWRSGPFAAHPLIPMAPHWPYPGQLRQSVSYPRLRTEEDDQAFSEWTNLWEHLGWQIYAAMHNDNRGTITVHMGVRNQVMVPDDVHTTEVPDAGGEVHSL